MVRRNRRAVLTDTEDGTYVRVARRRVRRDGAVRIAETRHIEDPRIDSEGLVRGRLRPRTPEEDPRAWHHEALTNTDLIQIRLEALAASPAVASLTWELADGRTHANNNKKEI